MKNLDQIPFRRVDKEELLQSVRKGVLQFIVLCANLEVAHEHPPADLDDRAPAVTAMIAFDGDYLGVVWVRCSEPLAVSITAGLLGVRPAGIDKNVRDALGNMVNIIGGDVKLFLCHGGCSVDLSLPLVYPADDPRQDFMDGRESILCSFLHGQERLLAGVTVRKTYRTEPA